jgi:carboxypeptidase family protein
MGLSPAKIGIAALALAVALAAVLAAISGWFVPSGDGPSSGASGANAPVAPRAPKPLDTPGRGRVVGYVRDVNGNPVSGARVRVAGSRRRTTTKSTGFYKLRVPPGRRTLVTEHPAHATQQIAFAARARGGTRLDFSLAVTRQGSGSGRNTADLLIFWSGCDKVADLSGVQLDRLMNAGVDGFVCSAGRLPGMGGDQRFTGDPGARLAGGSFRLQRALRDSAVVRRARDGSLRLYLGFKASDYTNPNTPFKEWFDDRAWSRDVLGPVRDLAAAARSLGFEGLALDQELYRVSGGASTASWSWDYPGSNRPEREVRAAVERRGRQLMTAMLAGYPGLELVAYDTVVPGNWEEEVQRIVNDDPDAFADDVRIDFWAGLASVQGYAAIRWLESVLYKSPHLTRDWSVALEYNANRTYSLLSRRFPNWEYAASRLHVTPFSWIDDGPSEFSAARDPGYVEEQLAAFRSWGAGGMFANYTYRGPANFDYEPYADAMRSASTAGTVDQEPPDLSITAPVAEGTIDASGDRMDIAGTAHDEFGIRVVRWYDGQDRFGTAEVVSEPDDGLGSNGRWLARWRIEGVPVSPGTNRITVVAEDIKGLARVQTLTLRR